MPNNSPCGPRFEVHARPCVIYRDRARLAPFPPTSGRSCARRTGASGGTIAAIATLPSFHAISAAPTASSNISRRRRKPLARCFATGAAASAWLHAWPRDWNSTPVASRSTAHSCARLAADFDVPVEFAQGSFIPAGDRLLMRSAGSFAWLTTTEAPAHEELGLATEDFGIIFAYPWPDEESALGQLFERHAGVGALLVTHHGGEDFRLRRKVG